MVTDNQGNRPPGMRVNPRTREVDRAARTLADYAGALQDEYDLTDAEMLKILIDLAAVKMAYLVRVQRTDELRTEP